MKKLPRFFGAVLCCLLVAMAPAFAQDAGTIRLSVSHDGTVKDVLDIICSEIDGSLLVRNSDVDLSRKVSIKMENATVNEVLTSLFGKSDVKWTISGKQIQIYRPKTVGTNQTKPTSRSISGTVKDAGGNPVTGAAVFVEGSQSATITDWNGGWMLEIPTSVHVCPLKVVDDYYKFNNQIKLVH